MFLHPLSSYYAQFYIIPDDVIKIVHSGLRKLIGGPSHWILSQAAQRLNRYFHYPFPPRDLHADNLAALSRIRAELRSLPKEQKVSGRLFMQAATTYPDSICSHVARSASYLRKYALSFESICTEHANQDVKTLHSLFYNYVLFASNCNSDVAKFFKTRLDRWDFPSKPSIDFFTELLTNVLPLPPPESFGVIFSCFSTVG